ncbi:30S ribosomal protein S2 [Candidatus Vidania fulgoroideorum]
MIKYLKLFKKNFIDKGELCKEIKVLNKSFISKKKDKSYFINIKKTILNTIKSSKILLKFCIKKKNILIISDSKFIKKKIEKIIKYKNVKISENIKSGNFTNFSSLLRENKKHKILKKILFKSKKKKINLYNRIRNNIKNKPINIFDSPKLVFDFRIKNKKNIFYKECKKLNIKIISFLCLKDNNKYIDIPIYFNYKIIKNIKFILELIKAVFKKYEKIYKNNKSK